MEENKTCCFENCLTLLRKHWKIILLVKIVLSAIVAVAAYSLATRSKCCCDEVYCCEDCW